MYCRPNCNGDAVPRQTGAEESDRLILRIAGDLEPCQRLWPGQYWPREKLIGLRYCHKLPAPEMTGLHMTPGISARRHVQTSGEG